MNALPILSGMFLLGVCLVMLVHYRWRKARQDDVITVEPMFQRSLAYPRKGGPFNFGKRGCC